jgi:exodeoxyribonuclease-3
MSLKISTWNINGIRAAIKKGLWEKINQLNPDLICFQETKAGSEVIEDLYKKYQKQFGKKHEAELFGDVGEEASENDSQEYSWEWFSATNRKGYSGVLTALKEGSKANLIETTKGLGVEEFDAEGRVLVSKFEAELDSGKQKIALINCYYPQGGRGQYRIDYKLNFYKEIYKLGQALRKDGYKLLLTGDFNTTVTDIDLARPDGNKKNTGCLPEERLALSWLMGVEDKILEDYDKKGVWDQNIQASPDLYTKLQKEMKNKSLELFDGFRYFYPDLKDKYSYWDQITRARERNVGWRIDMFLVDKGLEKSIKSCEILDQVMGSDHCPVVVEFR